MTTIGWALILGACLLISGAIRGRATYIGTDISDAFIALLSGDSDSLGEVLTRKGDTLAEPVAVTGMGSAPVYTTSRPSADLATVAKQLGGAAKGYRWTATGPDYYDCSGLMWRACQKAGLYNGPRFTTATFVAQVGGRFNRVATPVSGDIVLWRGHMGVCTGGDNFYSARSRRSGIGTSTISGWKTGGTPRYYRPNIKDSVAEGIDRLKRANR